MNPSFSRLSAATSLFSGLLLLTACGGGGGGGGGSSAGADAVDNSLRQLGVDTSPTTREGSPGNDVGDDYTPFGKRWDLNVTNELFVLGVPPTAAGSDPAAILEVTDESGLAANQNLFSQSSANLPWVEEQVGSRLPPTSMRAAAAADFDGDGLQEIVLLYQDGIETRLHTIDDATGNYFETDVQVGTEQAARHLTMAAGDLDGDGDEEVVLGMARNDGGEIRAFAFQNGNWSQQGPTRSFTRTTTGNVFHLRLAIGDIDCDSRGEIAVVRNEAQTTSYANGLARYSVFGDLTEGLVELTSGDVGALDNGGILQSAVVADVSIGDIDGDACGEIILAGMEEVDTSQCSGADYIAFVVEDGNENYAKGTAITYTRFFTGCNSPDKTAVRFAFVDAFDVDGDGRDEIHVNDRVFDDFVDASPWTEVSAWHMPQDIVWRRNSFGDFGETVVSMETAEMTGDGREDVVIYRQGYGLEIWGVDQINEDMSLERSIPMTFVNGQNGRHPLVVPVNVDVDGPVLRYSEGEYKLVFSEPIPIAALAAPPCIEGVQSDCFTSFGNTTSTSRVEERSVSVRASATAGFKVDGGFLTQSEFSLKATATVTSRRVQSRAYELSKTVNFIGGADEDTIVFTTIPLDTYTYEVVSHPDPNLIGREIVVSLPRDPITIQAERSFYNDSVKDAEDRIGDEVFAHNIGDPDSYPTAAQKNQLLSRRGGLQFGPQAVGQGGSGAGTNLQIQVGTTASSGGALAVDYEVELEATAGGAVAGYSVGTEAERSLTFSSGQQTTYSGTVGTIPNGIGGYSWGIFAYVYEDQATGREFQVVNYWVE